MLSCLFCFKQNHNKVKQALKNISLPITISSGHLKNLKTKHQSIDDIDKVIGCILRLNLISTGLGLVIP